MCVSSPNNISYYYFNIVGLAVSPRSVRFEIIVSLAPFAEACRTMVISFFV